MIINKIKTTLFLVVLSGIFLAIGAFWGGTSGLQLAFIMALFMNGVAYFFSDSIVLRLYKARPLNHNQYYQLYSMVNELCSKMDIPMPKLYIIHNPMANAFATGRNPLHASVAITTGLLDLLEQHELRGVLAHELSHIKNRDILIATVAATIATAIGYLANMAYYTGILGGFNGNRRRGNPFGLLLISIFIPIVAMLIRLAISRSREFMADESGARYTNDPLALASALQKLQNNVAFAHLDQQDTCRASTASLFIINPFKSESWVNLLATHPPIEVRIAKLQQFYEENILP